MTGSWTDTLKTLPLDGLRSVFAPAVADVDRPRQLDGDRKLVRRSKAVTLDGRRLQNCIQTFGRLPTEAESIHVVSEKRFSMMHLIPTVLTLAAPATIAYLGICTLSFSLGNLADLLSLLDAGQVRACDFCYSIYFRSNNKAQCQRLAEELGTRAGCRIFSGLIHAKILLLELSDGRSYVVESSANLRSCSSIEQFCLTHDGELLRFHRTWLDSLFTRAKT
jgi:hypothetical protein